MQQRRVLLNEDGKAAPDAAAAAAELRKWF
jgi:hypothetical protein